MSWRYELLIWDISAPGCRSSTRYQSASWAPCEPGRGGRAPEEDDDDDAVDELDVDDQLDPGIGPPRAACSFILRNASSAAARCRASRSSRSLCTRAPRSLDARSEERRGGK